MKPKFDTTIERMTAYCTYCPKMCRFSCPAAAAEGRETVTPWGMMRLLELAKDGDVTLDSEVADAFYHCTGCRRCQTFCAHDNDVPRALWEARSWAVDSGFLPEAYQELHEAFEEDESPYEAQPIIDESPFDDDAEVAFWPDCSTVAHTPELVGAIGRLLEKVLGQPVRLIRSEDTDRPPCCGFPISAAGIAEPDEIRAERWPAFDGVEQVWTDCPALAAWNEPNSSWQLSDDDDTPPMGHLLTLLAENLPDIGPPEQPVDATDCLLHQSCYVTRQLDGLDSVDAIVSTITDTPPEKLAYRDDESPCCGGRVHYRTLEPEASDEAAQKVVESLERNDGKERMVTTSSMCRHAMDEASDGEVVSSLLHWVCEAYGVVEG